MRLFTRFLSVILIPTLLAACSGTGTERSTTNTPPPGPAPVPTPHGAEQLPEKFVHLLRNDATDCSGTFNIFTRLQGSLLAKDKVESTYHLVNMTLRIDRTENGRPIFSYRLSHWFGGAKEVGGTIEVKNSVLVLHDGITLENGPELDSVILRGLDLSTFHTRIEAPKNATIVLTRERPQSIALCNTNPYVSRNSDGHVLVAGVPEKQFWEKALRHLNGNRVKVKPFGKHSETWTMTVRSHQIFFRGPISNIADATWDYDYRIENGMVILDGYGVLVYAGTGADGQHIIKLLLNAYPDHADHPGVPYPMSESTLTLPQF